jgi:hypothetical protein
VEGFAPTRALRRNSARQGLNRARCIGISRGVKTLVTDESIFTFSTNRARGLSGAIVVLMQS